MTTTVGMAEELGRREAEFAVKRPELERKRQAGHRRRPGRPGRL